MRVLVISHLRLLPADNGAKLRAFNLLRQLAAQHRLLVLSPAAAGEECAALARALGHGAAVRPAPWPPFEAQPAGPFLSALPRDVYRPPAPPVARALRALASAWSPDVLLATDPILGEVVRALPGLPRALDVAAEHSAYIGRLLPALPLARRPRWLLARAKWRRYNRLLARAADLWVVPAAPDAAALSGLLGPAAAVAVVPNGVDPEGVPFRPNPHAPAQVAHCGALRYRPNLDAIDYFCREIWPLVRRRVPEARLVVTGESDGAPPAVRRAPGVTLAGHVPDVQAVLHGSRAAVVPLRLGVGTRLKILEAMAAGTPVVATPLGAEGLEVTHGQDVLLAATAAAFAAHTAELLESPGARARLAEAGRALVEQRYAWPVLGAQLAGLLEGLPSRRGAAGRGTEGEARHGVREEGPAGAQRLP